MRQMTAIAATVLAALAVLAPGTLSAQLANPLAQATGMGGNYVSLARGFGAVSWNPAGLGMPDSPRFSLSIAPMVATVGLDPITPGDLARFNGTTIPHDEKVAWLDRIRASGGESGTAAADVTWLGLSIWRIGIQASSNVRGRINMAPDVAEVFFFGNAGLDGEPRPYSLSGSNFDMAGTTTVAASIGLPLRVALGPLPDQHFAVGATLKYTIGNFLMLGQEDGSTITDVPLSVEFRFPMIQTALPGEDEAFSLDHVNNGSGIGLDLGAAWKGGIFSAGATVRNVFNTFEWNAENLVYRAGSLTFDADTTFTDFEELPVDQAPARLLDRIAELYTFSPVLAAGAAARILPFLTLTGELRHALEDNLDVGARNHVGVGAELTILPVLPIRAGVSAISGGYQLSGGLGLRLAGAQLAMAAAMRESEMGSDALLALGLTIGLR